jgi:hypothetical protein
VLLALAEFQFLSGCGNLLILESDITCVNSGDNSFDLRRSNFQQPRAVNMIAARLA